MAKEDALKLYSKHFLKEDYARGEPVLNFSILLSPILRRGIWPLESH